MPSIGKYEILEQLGSGSMGTVYKGRDTFLDRMVALKTIRTGVNVELEARERFYREARTCARLNHPHIVSIFDLGEENGTSFIAMELLKGSDFRQLVERKEAIPLASKLIAMAQVCEALAHAHREGVIHRDVKPSNLFLLADGRAKVLDFGIAKLPTSHLTRAGAVLGTPNYMAPEQIQGLACDGRADLFSAAVVFFEFLTFQHPFQSNLIPQRILEDNPDSLFQHDPKLPRILEKIFARALAKKPDLRYATGDEFAADLRAVLNEMTQNSSPTFSRLELPSQSSLAVPPPIPATEPAQAQKAVAPAEADSRVSRMAKLLAAFNEQIERKDAAGARSSLPEIQSVAGADPKFRETVESCRSRLAALGQASVSSVGSNVGKPPAKTVPPEPTPSVRESVSERMIADKKRLALVGGILVVAAALLLVAPSYFRSVKEENYVASARVAAQQGRLLASPSNSAKAVATVQRGGQVRVLALPKSLATDWVHVQGREGDSFTRPGYLKASDLTEWDSKDADAALALARMSGPMENGSDAEIRAQIDRLNSVAASFSGKPAAGAASLDAARLTFVLAKKSKDANPAGGDWQTSLDDLSHQLEALRRDSALQSGADDLLKQIHEMMAKAPPASPEPGTPPADGPTDEDIKALLANAERLRKEYRYTEAKRYVMRVIKANPENTDALFLLKRINDAIELERAQ